MWQLPVLADTLIDYEVRDMLAMDCPVLSHTSDRRFLHLQPAQQLWQRLDYPYALYLP